METVLRQVRDGAKEKKLLEHVSDAMRLKHYSLRTERTYRDWIERFIRFHGARTHPAQMGETEVASFLTHLARDRNVAASTQNQALSALLFLYKEVLKQEIGWLKGVERAKKPLRLPVVLIDQSNLRGLVRSSLQAAAECTRSLAASVGTDETRTALCSLPLSQIETV